MRTVKNNCTDAQNETNGTPAELLTPVEATLAAHMERVVELAIHTKLNNSFYRIAQPYLSFIAERMSLTEKQALLLSLFLEMNNDHRIRINDFSDLIGCRTIRIISLMAEVETLIDRRFIRRRKESDGSQLYYMPADVVIAFKDNVVYEPVTSKGLSIEQLFDRLAFLFDDYVRGENLLQQIDLLFEENSQLEFCRIVNNLNLTWFNRMLLYIFCNRFINEDDDQICESDWDDFFDSKSILRMLRSQLNSRENELLQLKIIENNFSDGMIDTSHFKLSDKTKAQFFKELNIGQQQTKKQKELRQYTTLPVKQLFYNPRERSQIEQLSELLMPEKFSSVQHRLEENGMRKGFACLFYGSPGTGKTETVYQLARRTQRDLMIIDVSQIKSCWVGESEKNIKAAFDRYRDYVKQCERAPILLFNEADAVLGIRQEGAQRAVEKMENSIQNIILQEMEQLDGILIATTNLTQNLDKAFERRFIYKIEFDRPSTEAKRSIWQTMIPTLSAPVAEELAAQYDFSGGQIENIARKRTVELILNGEEPTTEALHAMCRTEQLSNNPPTERRKIGY